MIKNGIIALSLLFCMVSSTSLLAMEGLESRVKKTKEEFLSMTQGSSKLPFSDHMKQMFEFERKLNSLDQEIASEKKQLEERERERFVASQEVALPKKLIVEQIQYEVARLAGRVVNEEEIVSEDERTEQEAFDIDDLRSRSRDQGISSNGFSFIEEIRQELARLAERVVN